MKDRMERLVVLPFAVGCVSTSSIAVCAQGTRRPVAKNDTNPNTISVSPIRGIMDVFEGENKEEAEDTTMSNDNMRSTFRFLSTLPKPPNISIGFQRLSKTLIKNFSQFFVVKEETEEMEMEIGFPTDVKHVTHIGIDGTETTTTTGGSGGSCENIASEFLSLGAISLSQFELAMSQKANHSPLLH